MNHTVWPPNGHLTEYILTHFPPDYIGHAVDVGASDGISINTTYALEKVNRWMVLSVEANPGFATMLKKHRAFVEMCAVSDIPADEAIFHVHQQNPEAFSALTVADRKDLHPDGPMTWEKIKVRVTTLERLLDKWEFPQLDLLCIDTEGTELDVLKGLDIAHWKPKVIVVECWDKVGPIDLYLEGFGYKKTARNVDNDIWVRKT